jgi:transcriptional regulator with PAS, ATPase and Fis domain
MAEPLSCSSASDGPLGLGPAGGDPVRIADRAVPSLLLGKSEAVQRVACLAAEVALSDVTVLIEGESGTGKEIVARMIHRLSTRAKKPFIFVNCAALPEQLVEAELFGYVKGAFTDARFNKPGRFLLADRGTLFLDEIGDMPMKGQGDLLRVLEDGAFRMVGGTDLIQVDVRVLAATNKRLEELVAAGKFREDLFYRLKVIPISIPPLRERSGDIPVLVEHFLDRFCTRYGRAPSRLSAEAMEACVRFSWPGNVRQLRNAMEWLMVTTARTTIGVPELPHYLHGPAEPARSTSLRPGMTLEEAERVLIEETLRHATSNRAHAARLLGISRRSLQYKLRRMGLAAK